MAERFGPFSGEELRQLLPRGPSFLIEATHMIDKDPVATVRGMPNHFINMAGLLAPERRDLAPKTHLWLENLLSAPGTASKLASESKNLVSVEDVRVREYTREERHATVSWMKLGAELASVKMLAEVRSHLILFPQLDYCLFCQTMAKSEPLVSIGPDSGKLMEGALNSLKLKIEALEAKRAESMPNWWKEWRETSGHSQRSGS
jgi:hypothetical protein